MIRIIKVNSTALALLAILLLATALRLWNLSDIPPHLTPDEAALGYNAYSILKTGRDEYGEFLPIIFKSFGDYKPGLYIYLTVPFIAIFGLNELAVRLPSAIFGIVSVWLIYLVGTKLFNKKFAIPAAIVAAINPWSIYFSRGAWEANVSLALTLAGIYFFFEFLKKPRFLMLSASFFGLTLWTYQGAKLGTAVVVLILLIIYRSEILSLLRQNRKIFVKTAILGIALLTPIILSFFQGKTGRLEVFSVFSYRRPSEILDVQLGQGDERRGDLNYLLFHSEIVNFARGILGRWFNHFSARFLFFEGDWENPKHSAPYDGMFIFTDAVLLVLGLASLTRKGLSKEALFIWSWLFLAPLPSAISRDQVNAVRSFNLVVPLVFVLSLGALRLLELTATKTLGVNISSPPRWGRVVVWSIFGFLFVLSWAYFLDAYFVHLAKHNSKLWDYGYKQIVQAVTPIQSRYKQIVVQQSFSQPYIYFLFYGGDGYSQGYDPANYQKQATLVKSGFKGDVGYVTKLDNIEFAPIDWSINRGGYGTLFVADTIRIPPEDSEDENLFKEIDEIKYLDGSTAFRIIEVK